MSGVADAKLHLDEAMNFLTLEAYRVPLDELGDVGEQHRVSDFTLAEELERIDRALGPKGKSMFAPIADHIRSAYVEIKAAREALGK